MGPTLGIVGESGSARPWPRSACSVTRARGRGTRACRAGDGRDLLALDERELRKVRGNEVAMVFQDPLSSLHPLYRVGAQIVEAIRAHRDDASRRLRRRRSSCWSWSASPTQQARGRISARALRRHAPARDDRDGAGATSRKLLIADEPTTALDVTVQAQILGLLRAAATGTGMALVSSRTTSGWSPTSPTDRGHVCGPDRRGARRARCSARPSTVYLGIVARSRRWTARADCWSRSPAVRQSAGARPGSVSPALPLRRARAARTEPVRHHAPVGCHRVAAC